ncbi:MAG: hypothetical protein HYS86_02060 [Candidatus Chisholmbacteria bacterium]|nr:hypothetical protein [Candidatus Chisholmbacteria bacterium]
MSSGAEQRGEGAGLADVGQQPGPDTLAYVPAEQFDPLWQRAFAEAGDEAGANVLYELWTADPSGPRISPRAASPKVAFRRAAMRG